MKIDVSDLIKGNLNQKEVNLHEKLENIILNGDVISFSEPITLEIRIAINDNIFTISGKLILKLELDCHRCSKAFNHEMSVDINERYLRSEKVSEDFYIFSGNEINLLPMLHDNIITNIPMKMLCSLDCKGLCEVCGSNKNENQCNCKVEQHDPRLEKLLKLKKDL